MALEDPACFQAVAELTRRLVLDYDWDGVDFAELYFEAERGIFKHPKDFTPMHPTFRQMFKRALRGGPAHDVQSRFAKLWTAQPPIAG